MVLPQESTITVRPVGDIIKSTILGAFTFLTALAIRDLLTKTMESLVPDDTRQRLVFIYFTTSIVLFMTVLLAVLWQDTED